MQKKKSISAMAMPLKYNVELSVFLIQEITDREERRKLYNYNTKI